MEELRFYEYCLAEGDKTAEKLEVFFDDQHGKDGTLVVTTRMTARDKTGQDDAGNFTRLLHGFSKPISGRDLPEIRELLEKCIKDMSNFPDAEDLRRALEEFHKNINESGKAMGGHQSRSTLRSLVAVGVSSSSSPW